MFTFSLNTRCKHSCEGQRLLQELIGDRGQPTWSPINVRRLELRVKAQHCCHPTSLSSSYKRKSTAQNAGDKDWQKSMAHISISGDKLTASKTLNSSGVHERTPLLSKNNSQGHFARQLKTVCLPQLKGRGTGQQPEA